MTQSQTWLPGLDFPDREVWLKYRAPRVSRQARLIHDSATGPLVLGINAAKRAARKAEAMGGFGHHKAIVKARHAYYSRRHSGEETVAA